MSSLFYTRILLPSLLRTRRRQLNGGQIDAARAQQMVDAIFGRCSHRGPTFSIFGVVAGENAYAERSWRRLILDTSLTPLGSHGPHRVH